MSGTISLSPSGRWSAASWLFDWVLKTVATTVGDAELATELTGIVDENIGWLGLDDLTAVQGDKVRRAIRESLREAAEQGFSAKMPKRDEVLKHLDGLIQMASGAS
jgi:hypothetical protein